VVFLAVLLVAGAALLLPRVRGPREEPVEETERDAPIVAPSRVAMADDEARVVLDSGEISRIGLATAPLAPAGRAPELRLPGEVIAEPERSAVVRAPLAGRLAAGPGGWPRLGDHLTAGTELGRVSDARPLTAPIGGVVVRLGARPGEIVSEGQPLLELVDRSRPVVRIAWAPEAGRPLPRLTLVPSTAERRVEADLVGPAAEADPLTRRPAYLYRARSGCPGAVPGTLVQAAVPRGAAREGVLVPDRAVVQWDGLAWAYLRRAPGSYARVRVPTDRPVPGGWIAGPPLSPGDSVVVTGAEELLSEEFRARVTVGEETGE
jgi:multidrug efflux pump subunit AcrA (membrane-fusion protein)